MREKIVMDWPEWVPIDKRLDYFGRPAYPPRKPETRKPLLWLARIGNEVFLVNATGEILYFVTAGASGFQTVDDSVLVATGSKGYNYREVKPGCAVKVEEYDGYYDLDMLLQMHISVASMNLGRLNIVTPITKGGMDSEGIILWDTGESGKHMNITKEP